jgi:hypothetical protein
VLCGKNPLLDVLWVLEGPSGYGHGDTLRSYASQRIASNRAPLLSGEMCLTAFSVVVYD